MNELNRHYRFLKEHLGKRYYDISQDWVYDNPIIEFCGIMVDTYYNEFCYIIGTDSDDGIYNPLLLNVLIFKNRAKIFKRMKYYSKVYCDSRTVETIISRKVE